MSTYVLHVLESNLSLLTEGLHHGDLLHSLTGHSLVHVAQESRVQLLLSDKDLHSMSRITVWDLHLSLALNTERQLEYTCKLERLVRGHLKTALLHIIGHLHGIARDVVHVRRNLNFAALRRVDPLCTELEVVSERQAHLNCEALETSAWSLFEHAKVIHYFLKGIWNPRTVNKLS